MSISFKDRVAIVTGAGGGLGRAYALELARRGAKVVVNDLGGARDGTGHSDAALKVVEEIKAEGGEAMSNGGNVAEYEQMVEMVARAKEAWGSVHILINNAGILRDKTFAKMDMKDFELVVRVHLLGSAFAAKAVWETMRDQNYGRILMTSSSTRARRQLRPVELRRGQDGPRRPSQDTLSRRRQVQYPRELAGANRRHPHDRRHLPRGSVQRLHAENVAPAALYLVSDDAPTNAIVGAGGGVFQGAWLEMNEGVLLPEAERTVEGFAAAWDRINDRSSAQPVQNGMEQSAHALEMIHRAMAK